MTEPGKQEARGAETGPVLREVLGEGSGGGAEGGAEGWVGAAASDPAIAGSPLPVAGAGSGCAQSSCLHVAVQCGH